MLPEPFGQTAVFQLEEISRYDDRGPAWYWNNIRTGEHTGTHLDAPIHWVTGQDKDDVSQLPAPGWSRPPPCSTSRRGRRPTPTGCSRSTTSGPGRPSTAPLPGGGWLLLRTGWDARSHDQDEFLNADDTGPHTPGVSVECAAGWPRRRRSSASASRRSAPTPAPRTRSTRPFPCHQFLLGAGKYGLTQLQNLALLPPTGAVMIAGPLPIVGGSGSPTRVLALVER